MTFIDPTNDWSFKRIFGSRESGPVLVGFLNDLLHQGNKVIQSVKILDPYLPSQIKNLKNTAVDVRATLTDGSEVLIEMQMFPVAGYCERVLYNGAKCLSSQLGRGSDYTRIRPVTVITVADCVLLPETSAWLNHYALQEKKTSAAWPASGMEIIFIELPKVDLTELSASHPLHDWLEFLKNAATWRNIPRGVTNHAVRDALRLARHDNLSPSESQTMTKQQLYREDQKNMLLYAQREGMQQGMQQGDQKAAWRIARVSLAQGLSPELVATITGLPEKEIRNLVSPRPRAARVVRRPKQTA